MTIQVLGLMGSVKWDIKEIRSQHSSYVDRLLQVYIILVTLVVVAWNLGPSLLSFVESLYSFGISFSNKFAQ